MGLFDLFDDMKENNEKRKRASEYRRRAREYVRDGEALYNKAYSEVSSYSYETSNKIEQHYIYKQRVIKELGSDISPVLTNFNKFNIDSRVFEAPSISDSLSGKDLLGNLSSSFAPTLPIPSILDLFSDADEEYYEARRQRDEAKSYYENMKYERERLRSAKENMRVIRNCIIDEKQMLDNMVSKIKGITSQLKASMNKTSFSQAEANYLKGIHKIAGNISELISTKFLNDNFTITNQYQLVFEKIKRINASLESIPSISSGDDAIRRLLEIIDSGVRT